MDFVNNTWNSHRESIYEVFRFGFTGGVSTIVNYAFYYMLLLWLSPTVSFTMAYLVAMVINYLMTTSFTFRVKANKKNAVGFVVSNAINYILCALFLNLFIWVGISKQLAPIPMYMICIPINFLIVRFVMK